MPRRSLALALILSLGALVPVPLSLCAILSGLDGPCQCTMAGNCGAMPANCPLKTAPRLSCRCVLGGEPFPLARAKAPNAPPILASSLTPPAGRTAPTALFGASAAMAVSLHGPPGGRAGLCVYLI